MLKAFSAIARRLFPFRAVLWAAAALSLAGFAALVFIADGSARDESRTQLAALGLLWSLLLVAIAHTFRELPPAPHPDDGFFVRLASSLKRGFSWLLALVTTGTLLATVYISLQVAGMVGEGMQ